MSGPGIAIVELLLWGAVATAVLSGIQFGAQSVGFSRLSLPFLIGTCFSGNRRTAVAIGFIVYILGGWLFACLYFLLLASIGHGNWWLGAALGTVHGCILLAIFMPILPYLHPRMASPYDGPVATTRLHPPGFLALHYGYATPLVTLLSHACYGAILGAGLTVA
jgi:hypothetical protein